MKTLNEILWSPAQREAFASDLATLIEQQVKSRGGLRGMAVKTGFSVLKTAKPDLLTTALRRHAPQFIAALEPLYESFQNERAPDFSAYLQKHAAEARDALLRVADSRVENSSNTTVKSTYQKFRGMAAEEVEAAIPALGKLIRGYL